MVSKYQIYKRILNMPKMNYIRKHDNGYVVVFKYPKTQKIMAARSFDFIDYIDGKPETLYWAKNWRDKKYSQLLKQGMLPLPKKQTKKKRTWLNTEPKETGVTHIHHKTKSNKIKEAYITTWYEKYRNSNGYIIRTPQYEVFTISKYGRNQAKKLADSLWIQKMKLASIILN